MVIRIWLCLTMLLLSGCASEKPPQPFKFTFKPPDSVSFAVELCMVRKASQGDQSATDSTWTFTNHSQVAGFDGYMLTGRTDSVVLYHNGEPTNDPVIRLFAGGDITLLVDSSGRARDARGFEELMSQLDDLVGPDTAEAVRQMVSPQTLKAQEVNTWNAKFASFINREMVLKQAYPDTTYPVFPVEGRVPSYVISELVDTMTINGHLCGKVRVVASTNPAQLAEMSDRTEDEISALFGLNDEAWSLAAQRQAGHMSQREWVLEFATMLSHSESSHEEVFFSELSSSGMPIKSGIEETQSKKFSYPGATTP